MRIINAILKVVLCLLLVSPILGSLGIFPPPTREMYNTDESFAFIEMMLRNGYIAYMIAIVFAICIVLIATKRMALAALLLLPITVNIIGFHLFLDGGLFTMGAIMANVLALLNLYFLWRNRDRYRSLFSKTG
jgi:hypothetical protein